MRRKLDAIEILLLYLDSGDCILGLRNAGLYLILNICRDVGVERSGSQEAAHGPCPNQQRSDAAKEESRHKEEEGDGDPEEDGKHGGAKGEGNGADYKRDKRRERDNSKSDLGGDKGL